jgi:NCS1 family nucleobase:cation symporter-1
LNDHVQTSALEEHTIQQIPREQRHGKASDLFTIWFGANIMLLTVVTGALAVSLFKLPFFDAVIATVIGNLVGAVFMALHSAQGPQLGVPQMIQTRGQFGSVGALLVIGLVVVMYLGFFASNAVVGGQALHSVASAMPVNVGVTAIGLISLVAAIYGYDLIHAYARWMTYICGAALIIAFVLIVFVHGLPADFFTKNSVTLSGYLGAISVSALWQIAYAPYVSDYSRYMPEDTGPREAFWASYWGCSLGTIFPMVLGIVIAAVVDDGDIVQALNTLTGGFGPVALVIFSVGIAAANAMNLYCGALSLITIGQTIFTQWHPKAWARTVSTVALFLLGLACAILGTDNFMENYRNFLLLLLYVMVPWTAINLVDYYWVRHGQYHVPSFFRADGGVYGRVNYVAVICYIFGILIQVPFVSSPMYTGSFALAMDGADISWVVGMLVISPVYFFASKMVDKAKASPVAHEQAESTA